MIQCEDLRKELQAVKLVAHPWEESTTPEEVRKTVEAFKTNSSMTLHKWGSFLLLVLPWVCAANDSEGAITKRARDLLKADRCLRKH